RADETARPAGQPALVDERGAGVLVHVPDSRWPPRTRERDDQLGVVEHEQVDVGRERPHRPPHRAPGGETAPARRPPPVDRGQAARRTSTAVTPGGGSTPNPPNGAR